MHRAPHHLHVTHVLAQDAPPGMKLQRIGRLQRRSPHRRATLVEKLSDEHGEAQREGYNLVSSDRMSDVISMIHAHMTSFARSAFSLRATLTWSGGDGASSPGGKDRVSTPRLRASPSVRARHRRPATRHMSGSRASIARNMTHSRAPESLAVSYCFAGGEKSKDRYTC